MGKRQNPRPIFLPVLHGFRKRILLLVAQMPGLRILANDQGQLNIRQKAQKPLAPMFGAFRPWWQITGLAGSRIAKAHGKEGNSGAVIKHAAVNAHPAAQTLAAGIIERNAGLVDTPARRLPDNENAGRLADLKNRARPQGQMGFADFASSYSRDRCFKITRHNLVIAPGNILGQPHQLKHRVPP